MNEVLAREKAAMPPAKLARLNELEKAGLFGKGEVWEHGRYSEEYEKLAWGPGYFPFLYGARPDANYDPAKATHPPTGNSIARCGASTASSSSTAT